MATVDELLAGVSTVDKTLVISNDFRTINIPSSVPNLGVEYDDDVLRLDFKMPRYVSDTDLSTFNIRINYINSQGESDVYTVSDSNKVIYNDYITFSWRVGPTATRYKGNTKFNVCAKITLADGTIDKEFNTTIASLPVLEGLEVDEAVVTGYSDIIEQWRQELFGIGDTEEASIKAVSEAEQVAIENKGAEVLATIPKDYQTAVSMTDNADRTKADAITCFAQDEVVRVDDSSDDYLRGLKVFGKTTQVNTTGSQVLPQPYPESSFTLHGVTFTANDDGSIRIVGTNTSGDSTSCRFVLHGGLSMAGTYTYKCYGLPETCVTNIYYIGDVVGENKITFDASEDKTYGFVIRVPKDASVNATVYPMLNTGSTALSYEPYSGGKPSPNPEFPQELKSIEKPIIDVYGKNLLNLDLLLDDNFVKNDDGSYTLTKTGVGDLRFSAKASIKIPAGVYTLSVGTLSGTDTAARFVFTDVNGKEKSYSVIPNSPQTITATSDIVKFTAYISTSLADGTYVTMKDVMLEVGSEVTVYESYKPVQSISLDHSLPAIPVTQNGNYTDANGQQWICDEIDFDRGVYIQRTKAIEFNGTESWYISAAQYSEGVRFDVNISNIPPALVQNVMCDRFVFKGPNAGIETVWVLEDTAGFRVITNQATTPEEFQQFLSNNHTTVVYAIKTPIETPLTAEEIEWFRFAHTNFPTTTVLNDAGATMELEYNADTRLWLDNIPKVTDEQAGPLVEAWMDEHFADAEGVVYGKSAYEIAVERGFQGSEEYWLASLKGRDGKDGKNGEPGVDGADGKDGADGYTPVSGKDYFTDADKEELANTVEEQVIDTLTSGGTITIDDHVIEQGVTDIWTWRKWASGVAELWGIVTKEFREEYLEECILPFKIYDYNSSKWPMPVVNYSIGNTSNTVVIMHEFDPNAFGLSTIIDPETQKEVETSSWAVPNVSLFVEYQISSEDGEPIYGLMPVSNDYVVNVHMIGRWKPLE